MAEPAILFVKPKAISQRDKKALQTAGIIVIEIDDPASAKFVRAGAELDGSALLLAATRTIAGSNSDYVKSTFAKAICAAVEAQIGVRDPQ